MCYLLICALLTLELTLYLNIFLLMVLLVWVILNEMGKHTMVWWHIFRCGWPLAAKLADYKLIDWIFYSCALSPGNSRACLAPWGLELRTTNTLLARWGWRWKKSQSWGAWWVTHKLWSPLHGHYSCCFRWMTKLTTASGRLKYLGLASGSTN